MRVQLAQQAKEILGQSDLVPRFRNNVMVCGPGLLPQWEALR